MSSEKNRAEALRWLQTAQGDLSAAVILQQNGKFAHACFHAQQAAEKAIKAVWHLADADPWGHSIRKMIQDLESVHPELFGSIASLLPKGTVLDRFYIPTRYPNGLPDMTPEEAFTEDDARMCIEYATAILETVRPHLT